MQILKKLLSISSLIFDNAVLKGGVPIALVTLMKISVCFSQSELGLSQVLDLVREHSVALRQVETKKETSYWEFRKFKTQYHPQLVLSGNAPAYSKEYVAVRQPTGSILYQPVNQVNSNLNLGLEQPIYWTGGKITANSSLLFFNDFSSSYRQWNNQILNVQLSQPLLAFNPQKWNRRIQPIVFEESKRVFAEEREGVLANAVELFFQVLLDQSRAKIAATNLAHNDTIYKIEQRRFGMGTSSLERLLQVELQRLRSQQEVAEGNLDLRLNQLKLRSFIGLNMTEDFTLLIPHDVPPFDISVDDALQYAKQYRADFLRFERLRMEFNRDVAKAKGDRFATTLTATFGVNKSANALEETYRNTLQQQTFNIGLAIPIIDWGRNNANIRTALANKRLNDHRIVQEEIDFEQTVITQVMQFEIIRAQIEITKRSDEVAQKRYDVSMERYLMGKLDATNLNIALTEKDNARQSYILALKSFWTAYFELRRLTLFDFLTNSVLYNE
jgi:outer membrane protein TolC